MANFIIKKLIVTGKGKLPSAVNFDAGLNIVCGPSDTGKSYIVECIDYIFGSDTIPIDENTGYDCVKMVVETNNGHINLEREFNTNKIKVSSTDPAIESGDYGTRSGKLNANTDLWLKLIGVEERHQVIWKNNFEKKNLTWRYFLHMLLIKEERVIQRPSILLPRQNTVTTASLSSLLFLMTGEDFSDTDPREEKKLRLAKKAAVADYIHNQLAYFAERKSELDKLDMADSINIQAQVEHIVEQITIIETRITDAIRRDKQLLEEIFALNEHLTECNTLLNRYQALRSQYASDIKRLAFIVEGELHKTSSTHSTKCPFCNGEITAKDETSYIEASHAELHRIQLQMQDLGDSEQELVKERVAIETQLSERASEKQTVEALLNNELKPKAVNLKRILSEYRKAIEIQNEFAVIGDLETSMKSELFVAEAADEESGIEFSIKSRFDRSIMDVFDRELERITKACKYGGVGSARLGLSKFDVLVNEKDKSTFGKGYRAFLNTVLAITLMEYLAKHGKYAPGLLIVDSPILSLKERGDERASDSMKSALFQYLLDNQDYGQVIIIENTIPELEYDGIANVIRFTKDELNGRYGFLNGIQ